MTNEIEIFIDPDGTTRMIYDDDVRDSLKELESSAKETKISRAAHVEPNGTFWMILDADGKTRLSLRDFWSRAGALEAERDIVNARLA